jgi:uncharacterized protein (DUF433 family)
MSMETSWIEKNPDVCGGDACIRDTRHTVYGLVEWKNLGLTDERILEHHPDLSLADLQPPGNIMKATARKSTEPSRRMQRRKMAWPSCMPTRILITQRTRPRATRQIAATLASGPPTRKN